MKQKISGKKILLFGLLAVLLIGIPLTIYLVGTTTDTRSRANPSTNLLYKPDSSASAPIKTDIDKQVTLDVVVDPGENLVSFVKLEISYDPEKLSAENGAFVVNTSAFPTITEGPVYEPGKISVALSVGSDPTKAIQQIPTSAGKVTFTALSNTDATTPTQVSYGITTTVSSIDGNSEFAENVLSSSNPAYIAIGVQDTAIPTGTPAPTKIPSPTATPDPDSTPGPEIPNELPVCDSLSVDRDPVGDLPFSVTFTVAGSDTDGTINKVTFNFGDGGTTDVSSGGGIGTASVNAPASYTYNNAGTFNVSAVIYDERGGVSAPSDLCKGTVTVNGDSGSTGGGGGSTGGGVTAPTPIPTLEPTGSAEVALGVGIVSLVLMLGGAFIFLFL